MKRLVLFFILFGFSAYAQTAKEIIDNHIKAIGGKEKLDAMTTFKFEVDSGGSVIYYNKPGQWRKETIAYGFINTYSIYHGDKGWDVYSHGNVEPASGVLRDQVNHFLPGYLVFATEPSCKIEYLGTDDNTRSHLILITPIVNNTFGYSFLYSIDPVTWMIQRMQEISDGYSFYYYYENYTDFNGVRIPLRIVQEDYYTHNKKTVIRTNVKVNLPLENKLFEKPPTPKDVITAYQGANGKWGYQNLDLEPVIEPLYDNLWDFSDGLSRAELNGKAGFIDSTGKVIIAIKYEDAAVFEEGLVALKLNAKWGFSDKTGRIVIPFQYDKIISGFINGSATVTIGTETFAIDRTGKKLN